MKKEEINTCLFVDPKKNLMNTDCFRPQIFKYLLMRSVNQKSSKYRYLNRNDLNSFSKSDQQDLDFFF